METTDLLANDLQLWWEDGSLYFIRDAFKDGDIVCVVASALMAVWRFVKFSDSRWLTLGTSARTVVAALLTGIESLVQMIMRDKRCSKFYIRGFGRLTASRKAFLVKAAIVSRVSEGAQLILMEDSRVVRVQDDLWGAACEELKLIIERSTPQWALLASACDLGVGALADACIVASHTPLHFLWRRVMVHAQELPWSLARGDVGANLRRLGNADCPDEPTSQRIWLMKKSRVVPDAQLVAAIALLGEVSWTSLPAEQQHASLSMLHKWHPSYGCDMLVSRALMLQMTRLLPSMTADDRKAAAIVRKMQKVMNASPDRAHGRNMLVKSMIAICKGRKDEGRPGYDASMHRIAQHCFSRHAVMWAQQSMRQQA